MPNRFSGRTAAHSRPRVFPIGSRRKSRGIIFSFVPGMSLPRSRIRSTYEANKVLRKIRCKDLRAQKVFYPVNCSHFLTHGRIEQPQPGAKYRSLIKNLGDWQKPIQSRKHGPRSYDRATKRRNQSDTAETQSCRRSIFRDLREERYSSRTVTGWRSCTVACQIDEQYEGNEDCCLWPDEHGHCPF